MHEKESCFLCARKVFATPVIPHRCVTIRDGEPGNSLKTWAFRVHCSHQTLIQATPSPENATPFRGHATCICRSKRAHPKWADSCRSRATEVLPTPTGQRIILPHTRATDRVRAALWPVGRLAIGYASPDFSFELGIPSRLSTCGFKPIPARLRVSPRKA